MIANLRATWLMLASLMLAALFAGCNQQNVKPSEEKPALKSGYTCCNLHYNKDWINDVNYGQLPMIPAGSPIKVTGYGNYRASVEIDGKPFRLGLDYGRTAETTEQWVAKLILDHDPKTTLAGYPANVRQAIENGQIMVGMTKEQVIMTVGYPLTNENPRLEAPLWRYWWSSFGEYQVYWDGNRVSKVTGHPATLALILAPGNAVAAPAPAPAPKEAAKAPAAKEPTKAPETKKRVVKPAATGVSK
jgi:outer membrane protein assembly factor BamE (lipoprotein component of BamABCDE complex)